MSETLKSQRSKKAVGYIRISKQKEKGVSLEAQAEKIRAMAIVHDAQVEIVADDGETGKNTNRPGLECVLAKVRRREVDLVIVAKLDRLTRSVKDLAEILELFQRRNVSLVSVAESLDTGSASGRLVINIIVCVSQWESETIGERTATALAHKRARRRVFNHEPYGYVRNGDELIVLDAEQAAIGLMREWRACGWTFRRTARELDAAGTPTKSAGGRWHPQTIKGILESGLHSSEAAA